MDGFDFADWNVSRRRLMPYIIDMSVWLVESGPEGHFQLPFNLAMR